MSQAAYERESKVVKALQDAQKAYHQYLTLKWAAQKAVYNLKRGDFVDDGQGGRITRVMADIEYLFIGA